MKSRMLYEYWRFPTVFFICMMQTWMETTITLMRKPEMKIILSTPVRKN